MGAKGEHKCTVHNQFVDSYIKLNITQGTAPFMALEVLRAEGAFSHCPKHNLESFYSSSA